MYPQKYILKLTKVLLNLSLNFFFPLATRPDFHVFVWVLVSQWLGKGYAQMPCARRQMELGGRVGVRQFSILPKLSLSTSPVQFPLFSRQLNCFLVCQGCMGSLLIPSRDLSFLGFISFLNIWLFCHFPQSSL